MLAGGIDAYFVTEPVHTMNATSSLVAKTAAACGRRLRASITTLRRRVGERTLFIEADVSATDATAIARSSRISTRGSTASSSRPTRPRSTRPTGQRDHASLAAASAGTRSTPDG